MPITKTNEQAFVNTRGLSRCVHYYVDGKRGGPKKILLPRELVKWEQGNQQSKYIFPNNPLALYILFSTFVATKTKTDNDRDTFNNIKCKTLSEMGWR